jgi:isoaspartyl peptidase/L-asparaginase-like protein (Ntn-hydrolase superfamily)
MFIEISITAVVCTGAGVFIGRKYEQKIVAKVLSEFSRVDQDARSLVSRIYSRLTSGVKAELDKLSKMV